MVFWLVVAGYLLMALIFTRIVFVHHLNKAIERFDNDVGYARAKVFEWDLPAIIFGGLLWFVLIPGYGCYKLVNKLAFGETPIEKKLRREKEKEKVAKEAEEAARVLKKEGWKV